MEKMATNKTHNKSPVFKMGQLWHTIDDNTTADEEDTEEEEDINKDNNETMKLRREDMSLFGVCPAWDQFYLVVCEYCKQVIKPQALQKHIDLRHSYHKNNSNNQINNTLKVRTDSTNITSNTPLIRRTTSTITTATNITENGSDINDNSIKISDNLVNELTESGVKLKSSSSDIIIDVVNSVVADKSVDNCVKRSELSEQNETISKMNSKLINLLSPNISATIEPSVPEPTGPGPGFATVVSADTDSVTISVPEIKLSPKLEPIIDIEVTAPLKPVPKKKSYKKSANPRKLLPCKDREYDPNKHCGVCLPDMERPCTRSLTCKTHSLTLRRAVQGRIKNFDELLTEHREAKEAALRAQGIEVKPTKKAIQKQQQQLKASQQLQLKAEESQLSITDKSLSTQPLIPINRTLVFSESQPMVSNITTNSNSLLSFVSPPICSTLERTHQPVPTPQRSHLKLDQIEVESDGSMFMRCHPKPAAICNFNIRKLERSRLLNRNYDLTLAALGSTFNSPLLVSKLTNNQKCSSTPSPIAIKSPLRNANQTFSANKKLRISIDSESLESSSDAVVDPYNFADAITTSANSYTYVKPKTTIAKTTTNASKKKKKSDINCSTYNSSLLSNGQLFHSTNSTKTTGSTAKKKSVVKKNVNNSHNTSISADFPLTNSSAGSDSIDSVVSPNCEQLIDPSTSLISEVPQRNLNDILSNSIDSSKSDNGSILLNGSLLSYKRNTFSALSKQSNIDIKESINKKTIFAANSLNSNNNNTNNRFLLNSLSPPLTSISSGLSINAISRPIIQKQSLPSSTVNNNLTQSQNMSQISQSLHNTTHTIFIKSAKQSLQNQLIPTISSPKLLSKTEDYTS